MDEERRAGPSGGRGSSSRPHKDNLTKRCDCGPRKQLTCAHPWHIDFYRGRKFRFSLDVLAKARGVPLPRTKDEAEAFRDRIRGEIRDGVFKDPHAKPEPLPADTRLTVADVAGRYLTDYVQVPTRRKRAAYAMECHVNALTAAEIPAAQGRTVRLGDKPMADVTADDVESVRRAQRQAMRRAIDDRARWEAEAAERAAEGKPMTRPKPRLMRKGGEVGINRLLARARHLFAWAKQRGIITASPFGPKGEPVVTLESRAEDPRDRRLRPGEEAALLQHAGPHLQAVIIGALQTGARSGELLNLQWKDIEHVAGPKGELVPRFVVLPAGKTKTYQTRRVPVTQRLASVLAMRRTDPDGERLDDKPDGYVFGNEVGEAVGSIKTAWRATCRRAGIEGLTFHDLRREFASRLMESGAEPHEVRDWLGHANITTTSRYLRSTPLALERTMKRFEQHERGAEPPRSEQPENRHTAPECDNQPIEQLRQAGTMEVLGAVRVN
jgi:integrase